MGWFRINELFLPPPPTGVEVEEDVCDNTNVTRYYPPPPSAPFPPPCPLCPQLPEPSVRCPALSKAEMALTHQTKKGGGVRKDNAMRLSSSSPFFLF